MTDDTDTLPTLTTPPRQTAPHPQTTTTSSTSSTTFAASALHGGATPAESAPPEHQARLGLSLSQVVGGSLAATTAAALGARLGVAGTLVGAAVASVVSAVAGAAYTHSLRRTREIIRTTRVSGGSTHDPAGLPGESVSGVTTVRVSRPPVRLNLRRIIVATVSVFAVAAIAITGFELVSGRALDGGSGTTASQLVPGGSSTPKDSTPKATESSTPTATVTTTVTAPVTSGSSSSSSSEAPSSSSSSTAPTSAPPTTQAPRATQPTP